MVFVLIAAFRTQRIDSGTWKEVIFENMELILKGTLSLAFLSFKDINQDGGKF